MGLGAAELTFLENGRGVPISRGCQSLGSADTLCEKAESKVNPCHVPRHISCFALWPLGNCFWGHPRMQDPWACLGIAEKHPPGLPCPPSITGAQFTSITPAQNFPQELSLLTMLSHEYFTSHSDSGSLTGIRITS